MADGSINIDTAIDSSTIDKEVQKINKKLSHVGEDMSKVGRRMNKDMSAEFDMMRKTSGRAMKGMSAEAQGMANEMRQAFTAQKLGMLGTREEQLKIQHGYFKMAQGAKTYKGTTQDFMKSVGDMGAKHKKVTEDMMKSNELQKISLFQTVGTMMNMSTQSSKISANYDRMKNPMLSVNKLGLSMADGLNKIANRGNASVLALKMLGPTADMKKLNDMTMMINQGIMRMGMVALIAGAATVIMFSKMAKAAMGPKPSDVFKKQAEALAEYRDAVKARTEEIMNAWGIFEDVQLEKTSGKKLIANLEEQIKLLGDWKTNLVNIAAKAGPEFAKYLSDMGPSAAAEVAAISAMSQPELDKYVALWKEKMKMAKDQAVGELEGMRIATAAKIKALQDTLKPLGVSVEAFKGAWAGAFGPIIEIFGQLAAKVVDVGTKVGEFFSKLAENNPTLSAIVFGFLALIPVLTLILSPLAVGIGLFGGVAAAMSAVWMLIGPVITGFAAMMGTVILVAAIIVGLVVAFKYLWNNVAWFRDGLTAAWDYIKKKTAETWAAIVKAIQPAIQAVTKYVMDKLAVLLAFWQRNGSTIVGLAKLHFNNIWLIIKGVMGYILGIFQAVWPIISNMVKVVWGLIKLIIDSALDYILGIIKVAMALLKGDWKGAWTAIKDTVKSIWKNIEQFFKNINLKEMGKDIIAGLIKGIASMSGAVGKTIKGIVDNIKEGFKGALSIKSPSKWMEKKVGKWIPAGVAVGIDKNQQPLTSAISGMASKIGYDSRSAMGVNGSKGGVTSSSTTNNNSPVSVHLTYNGNNPQDGAKMVDMVERELNRRLGRKSFMRGATTV